MKNEFKIGIVLFNPSSFGGATKRFSNLFKYFLSRYPDRFFYFVNGHFYSQLKELFPEINSERIIVIGKNIPAVKEFSTSLPKYYESRAADPYIVDLNVGYARKLYWFVKNRFRQKSLFGEIESHRKRLGIELFLGVFSGGLPLVFYLNQSPRKSAVIFSDMDSWSSDIFNDTKRFWYRKYYSFNNILENADAVDFLSPYVKQTVVQTGIKLINNKSFITPCSFTDYSKCIPGEKKRIEIAFCGRLEPNKNPMMYLEAAKEISKHYDVRFHLLGEGSLVNEIQSFINENSLGKKVFFQFHKNPPEIFSETSIFVSIQATNNYPSQSVLEAMACGNAIIASDVGDTRMFINESNGILIPLNTESLVAALKQLIEDKEKIQKMGMAAVEFVKSNHTVEKCGDYYLALFEKVHHNIFG